MQIDLRSDTFTQPTSAMLEAMFQTKVGDDVFGEDPSVNQLEAMTAELFGMEAALFCPSGTMTNQIGIKVHTRPGDEIICEDSSHVYIYEGGGIAFNSQCQVRPIKGNFGRIYAPQIEEAINPDDVHKARTSLVCLENTSNRGGGSCYHLKDILDIKEICIKHHIALHLDGARLWNALVAKNENPRQYGAIFDSISVCFSKGLGAPVGSILLGKAGFIREARRVRKKLGGGMRQAGYLAAAGIYAIEHHIARLSQDHHNAKTIGSMLLQKPFIKSIFPVETNILIFELTEPYTASQLTTTLQQQNIRCMAIAPRCVRMVFHLDISDAMMQTLIDIIEKLSL